MPTCAGILSNAINKLYTRLLIMTHIIYYFEMSNNLCIIVTFYFIHSFKDLLNSKYDMLIYLEDAKSSWALFLCSKTHPSKGKEPQLIAPYTTYSMSLSICIVLALLPHLFISIKAWVFFRIPSSFSGSQETADQKTMRLKPLRTPGFTYYTHSVFIISICILQ